MAPEFHITAFLWLNLQFLHPIFAPPLSGGKTRGHPAFCQAEKPPDIPPDKIEAFFRFPLAFTNRGVV